MGRCKPLGCTELIPFTCISVIWSPFCFLVHLTSCISPVHQQPPRGFFLQQSKPHSLDPSFENLHSHLEARNCWWLWHFLFLDLARDTFISQSFPIVIKSTIFGRHFMTFFFFFWSHGTVRLIPDQVKVLTDMSNQLLISGLDPLINNKRLSGSSIFLSNRIQKIFPCCFFPYLELQYYHYFTL